MATVVVTLQSVCSGSGHAHLSATVNDINKGEWTLWADDVLKDITDDEIEAFIKLIIRAHKIGRTKAQVRADLQTGLVVTV